MVRVLINGNIHVIFEEWAWAWRGRRSRKPKKRFVSKFPDSFHSSILLLLPHPNQNVDIPSHFHASKSWGSGVFWYGDCPFSELRFCPPQLAASLFFSNLFILVGPISVAPFRRCCFFFFFKWINALNTSNLWW